MQLQAQMPIDVEKVTSVLEHSITWEDDIWKADPFDVVEVHYEARLKYRDLINAVTSGELVQARIMLFHGQSGAGKTHLVRALRTATHGREQGYFGYAQMTPDVANYADYFLRRLVNSLEKPYSPYDRAESGLARLSRRMVEDAGIVDADTIRTLREADLEPANLSRLVIDLADEIVAAPELAEHELDINIVRALLYIQRNDPRIDQRVRQYLCGRELNEISHSTVTALDPNGGEDRAFEIIESLGRLMMVIDGAALVFCIDQVEDLRFYDDAEGRFQKAVRDLIQIANRVPSSIILISCLGDFYGQVRGLLPQSFIDRVEKAGPVLLSEARTAEEARLIISGRLKQAVGGEWEEDRDEAASIIFGGHFFEEVAGLSTRRLLEMVQDRWREMQGESEPRAELPVAAQSNELGSEALKDRWDRFVLDFEVDIPPDEEELAHVMMTALQLAAQEARSELSATIKPLEWLDDVTAFDLDVRHLEGGAYANRIFICNKGSQGGALKRQVQKVVSSADNVEPIIIRASEFPPSGKNATAQALRHFTLNGGRRIVVPIYEWDRMITLIAFRSRYGQDASFAVWLESASLLGDLPSIEQLLRLDLAKPIVTNVAQTQPEAVLEVVAEPAEVDAGAPVVMATEELEPVANMPAVLPSAIMEPKTPAKPERTTSGGVFSAFRNFFSNGVSSGNDWSGDYVGGPWAEKSKDGSRGGGDADTLATAEPLDGVLLSPDTVGNSGDYFPIGHVLDETRAPIGLSKGILRRHAAMLGGSGSGKTTLALSVVEQLLMSGIPVVLIDRKGDLCSYANPDVWRPDERESQDRQVMREELGSMIDVAVYTPGRTSGRPIGITLLPHGIAELPEHEQQLLANVSAAAIGDMLHLKNSATHQRQGGILAVALKLLGSRSTSEVTLADLIFMLENDDEELIELTQRMDATGKLRRDLIAQLDSLRHRNWALFEGGGEPLRMESLLGLGRYARKGRTRLSAIYTGFLGDNENILFWVAQFLSEALRFCQRNPNDDLQAVIMFDEADLYIPANSRPATSEPLQSLLKRARSAGVGIMLATQSPGDLDYKSRDQITSWFIGRVREDTALRKLRAAFAAESGLDPARVLPNQTVGEFHLIQEATVKPIKSQMSLIQAEQVPFDRIEQLARETKGQDTGQLKLEF
ncbi:MAG: helicase HerA-like domain-containing protein [Hyphomicrobiaceae bacterium]